MNATDAGQPDTSLRLWNAREPKGERGRFATDGWLRISPATSRHRGRLMSLIKVGVGRTVRGDEAGLVGGEPLPSPLTIGMLPGRSRWSGSLSIPSNEHVAQELATSPAQVRALRMRLFFSSVADSCVGGARRRLVATRAASISATALSDASSPTGDTRTRRNRNWVRHTAATTGRARSLVEMDGEMSRNGPLVMGRHRARADNRDLCGASSR
jgi:hypothetical protein